MINITSSIHKGENLQLQKKNEIEKKAQISFEGNRTDHNLISELTNKDGEAIFKPKARAIEAAISRMANDGHTDNVNFLLNVAENLQYGVKKGSALDQFLSTDSSIAKKEVKQNVNWEGMLEAAIAKALKANRTADKADLQARFDKLFPSVETEKSVKWVSVNPNIALEKEVIKYRNQIINSAEFKNHSLKRPQNRIQQHLDYFVASSEVAVAEKAEILKQFANFMSDNYEINPQIADRKVQILDEMIADIVVKVPGRAMLTTKNMLQKHGSCAAISTSRKAMAHEHKLAYVSNLLAEFNAKPTMEVWDVTDPKNEAKITVQKANIDYKAAIAENYRLVDAAVTNWMHIADNMGNGLTKNGQFIPFDVENYGMFRDAHLMVDMAPEYQPKYDLFRAMEKLQGAAKAVFKDTIERKHATQELKNAKLENVAYHGVSIGKVENILKELATEAKTDVDGSALHQLAANLVDKENISKKIGSLEDEAIKLNRAGNNDAAKELRSEMKELKAFLIDSCEGPQTKKSKLTKQIQAVMPEVSAASIEKVIDKVLTHFEFVDKMVSDTKELEGKFNLKGTNAHNKKLFTLAAYNRVCKEREVKIPERLAVMAENLGVKADAETVLKKLEDKGEILPRTKLDAMYQAYEDLARYEEKRIPKEQKAWKSDKVKYAPFEQFKADFKAIEKQAPSIKKEVHKDRESFKSLKTELEPQLDAVYRRRGEGSGAFWVGKEGSSGLNTGQYSRLLKQLSGKDHFVEGDVKKMLDHIEQGKGGSVTGTMVEHYEFSGHAQYVEDVITESIINKETGKKETQRVLYHDNTWGKAETKHTWVDDGGHLRTDYGSRRGGPEGYLLSPGLTQGTTEKYLTTGVGIHHPEKIGMKWAEKLDNSIGTAYPMMMDVILKGSYLSADKKANAMVAGVFEVGGEKAVKQVQRFFQRLAMGNVEQLQKAEEKVIHNLIKVVNNAIDANDATGIEKQLTVALSATLETIDNKLFLPGAKKVLKTDLSSKIAQAVTQMMAMEGTPSSKKVEMTRMVMYLVDTDMKENAKYGQAVQMKKSDAIEEAVKSTKEQLYKLVRGNGANAVADMDIDNLKQTGIKTREDYDAVPETHLLKVLLNKMSMIDLAESNEAYMAVDKAKTPEDFTKAFEIIVKDHKKDISAFFGKDQTALVQTKEAFLETAKLVLEETGKANRFDLSQLNSILDVANTNISIRCKGSVAKYKEFIYASINQVVQAFNKGTEGKFPQVEATLKEALTKVANETFKENLEISSVEELGQSFIGRDIINWIDAKFDPRNDAQFIEIANKLLDMKTENFNKLLDKSTPEELGLKVKDPYYMVEQLRGLNSKAEKAFGNAIHHHVINEHYSQKINNAHNDIIDKHKKWTKTEEGSKVPKEEQNKILSQKLESFYKKEADIDSLFRDMQVRFSYIGMDKVIKAQKADAEKYGVRPGFPVIKIVPDQEIKDVCKGNLENLEAMLQQIAQMKEEMAKPDANPAMVQAYQMNLEQVEMQTKMLQQVLVKGSMRPRHQDDVMRGINQWLKVASKEPGSAHADNLKKDLVEMMFKEHILNYPSEFLENAVKEVPKMVGAGGMMSYVDQQVMQMWEQAAVACLTASSRANIEFKIKENISKGKMPQIAKALRGNDMIVNPKTHQGEKLESKVGMEFLFKILQDPANNNHTLKYFIQQAGLTEPAIDHFLKGINPDKYTKMINMNLDHLMQIRETQEIVQDTFEQFIEVIYDIYEKLDGGPITVEGLETAIIPRYFKMLDMAFKDKDTKMLDTYKRLIEGNLEAVKANNLPAPEGDALNFLLEWQQTVLDGQDKMTDALIERTITYMNDLNGRIAGVKQLEDLVPSYSPLKADINEFQIKATATIKEIDKIRGDLQDPLLDKIEAATKEQRAEQAKAQQQYQNMSQEQLMEVAKQQAKQAVQELAQAIIIGDQQKQQVIVKQIMAEQNPILDQEIVNLFMTTDHPIVKTFAAGFMAQKGYIEPLYDLVDKSMDENGVFDRSLKAEENQALVFAVDALINGTNAQDEKLADKMAVMLADYFHAVCDSEKPTQLMDQLFNTMINRLPNAGQVVENMLMDQIIYNEETSANSKIVAINILGRTQSMAFYPVFEEIATKPELVAELAEDQICLIDVALMSAAAFIKGYPALHDYSVLLNNVKAIDLEKLVAQAKQEETDGSLDLNSVVSRIKERITGIEEMLAQTQAEAA